MIVFDTDIITLLSYGQTPKLRERLDAVSGNEVLAVTVFTLMEVLGPRYDAIYKAANKEEMLKAADRFRMSKHVLDGFTTLYPSDDSSRRFDELMKSKKGRKRKKDRADMLIASVVLAHSAMLVTRNTDDYQGIKGLHPENWAD